MQQCSHNRDAFIFRKSEDEHAYNYANLPPQREGLEEWSKKLIPDIFYIIFRISILAFQISQD
eukprot:SAG11_NODE_2561_length_3220_cov_1.882730_3_plen_63_part_00